MPRMDSGSVVVVTGASSGIGRAAAVAFARKGASVVLAARREHALEDVAAEVQRLGGRAAVIPTDVADESAVHALAQQAVERFGHVDVWVNNASVYVAGEFEQVPPEAFRRVMDVNFFGYVAGARAILPHFRQRGRGVIVNTGSIDSLVGFPYFSPYVASKWAVKGFADSLRWELLGTDVKVGNVLPASIGTPLFDYAANYSGRRLKPMNPVNTAEQVAKAIVSCAERPRDVYTGRGARSIAWAYRFMPAVAGRMLRTLADRDHLLVDEPGPRTEGNLYRPIAQGTAATDSSMFERAAPGMGPQAAERERSMHRWAAAPVPPPATTGAQSPRSESFGHVAQVLNKRLPPSLMRVGGLDQDERWVYGRQDLAALGLVPLAAAVHELEVLAEHGTRGDGTQTDHDARLHEAQLAVEPDAAGGHLTRLWRAVLAAPAWLLDPRAVLHRISHVGHTTIDAGGRQRVVE